MKKLEPTVTIGSIDVAAVVETFPAPISAAQRPRKVPNIRATPSGVWVSKHPIAVLLRIDGAIRAFSSDGAALPLSTFDAAYPGLREQFENETRH